MSDRIIGFITTDDIQLLSKKITKLIKGVESMTMQMEDLSREVGESTTVMESASTLISNLADEIRALKDDPAALAALAQRLDASSNELAEAVAMNTAAEEEPMPTQ
jgi:peptidoglycan hydrolase CwlO-like protein